MFSFLKKIPRQVTVMGWVSFFTDLASEMLYPIIPLFLASIGVNKWLLGMLEGIAEGISTGLRWLGGVLSDYTGKRKPFVFWGYTISALSKPIMGLAAFWGWGIFLAGRASDRFGKSIRTAARDALIADATPKEHRGLAFGFHRAMDTAGAVLGPLIALAILLWSDYANYKFPLHYLFFIAVAPGLISSLLVVLFVKEHSHAPAPGQARERTRFWQTYPRAFWVLIAANFIFSLGNSSDSLLILRATEIFSGVDSAKTVDLKNASLAVSLFAVFNIVYAVLATPAGHLSDRLSRKTVITIGWFVYAIVYAGFSWGQTGQTWLPWVLFGIYGMYQAFAEGVSKALISDLVPSTQRAGAIGLFYTVSGLGQFLASFATGYLWENSGPTPAFLLGAVFPILAIPVLLSVRSKPAKNS